MSLNPDPLALYFNPNDQIGDSRTRRFVRPIMESRARKGRARFVDS